MSAIKISKLFVILVVIPKNIYIKKNTQKNMAIVFQIIES